MHASLGITDVVLFGGEEPVPLPTATMLVILPGEEPIGVGAEVGPEELGWAGHSPPV